MSSFRSKPTGWRYESSRHALAARGISSTKRYEAKMSDKDVLKNTKLISEKAELVRLKQKLKMMEKKWGSLTEDGEGDGWTEDAYERAKELEDDIEQLEESIEEHEHPTVFHKKYMSEQVPDKYDKVAGFLKSLANDGRAKVDDFHAQHKQRVSNELVDKYSREFSDNEASGIFRSGAAKSFMNDDLTTETKDFLDEKIDEATYRANLERRAGKHRQQYSSTLDIFGVNEKPHTIGPRTGSLLPESLQGSPKPVQRQMGEFEQRSFAYAAKKDVAELYGYALVKGKMMPVFATKEEVLKNPKKYQNLVQEPELDQRFFAKKEIDAKLIKQGAKVEREHAATIKWIEQEKPTVAEATKRIARDHILESERYYPELKKMEKRLEK